MELPNVLQSVLGTIMEKSNLNSWNIYEERDGSVCCKLKFVCHDGPVNNSNQQHIGYRRRTEKQKLRDNQRSRSYQQRQAKINPTTSSQNQSSVAQSTHPLQSSTPQLDSCGVRTRSMQKKSDVEIPRCSQDDSILNPKAEAFIMPVSPEPDDISVISDLPSSLSPHIIVNEEDNRCHDVHTPKTGDIQCTLEESPMGIEDDQRSDCSTTPSQLTDCEYFNCSYARRANKVYSCSKCGLSVCEDCYTRGVHKRHKDNLSITGPSQLK